jgi:ribonuclease HI
LAKIEIYSDGSSRGNPGRGGYGAVLISGDLRKEISGGFKYTTNNRMELLAVISALECLKKESNDITIYSDSQYVINPIEKGWLFKWIKNKKDFPNSDLWFRFLNLYKKNNIKFIWVKGHSDNEENNRCDFLATKAAQSVNLKEDSGYIKK